MKVNKVIKIYYHISQNKKKNMKWMNKVNTIFIKSQIINKLIPKSNSIHPKNSNQLLSKMLKKKLKIKNLIQISMQLHHLNRKLAGNQERKKEGWKEMKIKDKNLELRKWYQLWIQTEKNHNKKSIWQEIINKNETHIINSPIKTNILKIVCFKTN